MRFTRTGLILLSAIVVMVSSCSHKYDANVLDLGFYQWNMWPDKGHQGNGHDPSCGWEDLHRGMGKLVRIPAALEEHFQESEYASVTWFHCRYTLPELWKERKVKLRFAGISQHAEVFLNGELAGSFQGEGTPFEIDVTERIFYTRDNHLAVRINGPPTGSAGITGSVLVVSAQKESQTDRL